MVPVSLVCYQPVVQRTSRQRVSARGAMDCATESYEGSAVQHLFGIP
jgi:hypothetical protein